jgi:hypothetical protein
MHTNSILVLAHHLWPSQYIRFMVVLICSKQANSISVIQSWSSNHIFPYQIMPKKITEMERGNTPWVWKGTQLPDTSRLFFSNPQCSLSMENTMRKRHSTQLNKCRVFRCLYSWHSTKNPTTAVQRLKQSEPVKYLVQTQTATEAVLSIFQPFLFRKRSSDLSIAH